MAATEGRREGTATRDPLRSWIEQQYSRISRLPNRPSVSERRALVDRVISAQMRALLHFPDFQALESLWRSIFFLVRRAETDQDLSIWLIDVSRQELDEGIARCIRPSGRPQALGRGDRRLHFRDCSVRSSDTRGRPGRLHPSSGLRSSLEPSPDGGLRP